MKRRTRSLAALIVLATTLFAPFAAVARVCADSGDMASMAEARAVSGASQGVASSTAAMTLCERHCHAGKISQQPVSSVPSALLALAFLRVGAIEAVPLREPRFDSPFAAAAGPSPPLIGYTVLRI